MRTFKTYISTEFTGGFVQLVHNPEGLDSYGNKLMRHKVYKSVFVDITLDLNYVKDGFDLLKAAFDSKYWSAEASLIIEELNTQTNDYEIIYEGDFDFNEYAENETRVKIPTINSGRVTKVRTREKNKYNLAKLISTDNVVVPKLTTGFNKETGTVNFPEFSYVLWAIILPNWDDTVLFPGTQSPPPNEVWTLPLAGTEVQNVMGSEFTFAPPATKFYTANAAKTVSIQGLFNMDTVGTLFNNNNATSVLRYDWSIRHKNSGGGLIEDWKPITVQLNYLPAGSNNVDFPIHDFALNKSFTMATGDYLEFYTIWVLSVTWADPLLDWTSTNFTCDPKVTDWLIQETVATIPAYNQECWFPFEGASRMIQLMTSETSLTNLLKSDYLGRTDSAPIQYLADGAGSLRLFTSGMALRGYAMHSSFLDLFKSLSAIDPIGFWFDKENNIFEIEPVENYYKDTVTVVLGEVTDYKRTVEKDKIFGSIDGGFNNSSSSDVINGVIEFNTAYSYSSPITYSKNLQLLKCPFRGDTLGINLPKAAQILEKESNDLSTDKDNFILDTSRAVITIFYDYQINTGADLYSISGMPNAEAFYNPEITPKRNLLRNGKLIRSYCDKLSTKTIQFVNSKNLVELSTQLTIADPIINEQDDVLISDLDTPLFEPILYEFKYATPKTLRDIIKAGIHGQIHFYWKGQLKKGFIKDVTLNNHKNEGTFILNKVYEV